MPCVELSLSIWPRTAGLCQGHRELGAVLGGWEGGLHVTGCLVQTLVMGGWEGGGILVSISL